MSSPNGARGSNNNNKNKRNRELLRAENEENQSPNSRRQNELDHSKLTELGLALSPVQVSNDLMQDFDDNDLLDAEDEATMRDNVILDNVDDDDDDDDGEDLFGDGFERDYRSKAEKDTYDSADLDDREFSDMSEQVRASVDRKLNQRDREIARREGRVRSFFDGDDEDRFGQVMRSRSRYTSRLPDDDMDDEYNPNELDPNFVLDDLKGQSVAEWVTTEQPRQHIANLFRKFLHEFLDENGNSVYSERIQRMCEQNGRSLEVSYLQLANARPLLALWLSEAPKEMLEIFNEVAGNAVKEKFDRYDRIADEIHVRISDVPTTEALRDLRHHHVNKLVRVSGVVTKRSAMLPQIKYVTYACAKCSTTMGPFKQLGSEEPKVSQCVSCESRGPFIVKNEQTTYRDYQKITLQEAPGSVPPGRLPRSKDVILLWDLVDYVRPGEAIEITGIYKNIFDVGLNATHGFPLFMTVIEANHISKREDAFSTTKLSQEDRQAIMELSKDPRIARKIIKSIAPSIFGHQNIKTAMALSLFGGVPKDIQGKQRLRGDINILMMGDPGTAKSQFLKYVEKTANRAVFTTGQGASAVGLTASVQKSPITREWTLEGGALVLADKGVCLIDEFDKMNEQDRTSIHEAMEQQSISVSKAGIICTLQARCAVMAAANPKSGRYLPYLTFQENVELTEPILSRFDVLCVVKDSIDVEADRQLAEFVVQNHIKSHPDAQQATEDEEKDPDLIDQDLLRKYIMYAKENISPRFSDVDSDKLAKVYSALRKESLACGSIPMTVRHVESMIRMAEAHARMHLREFVRQDDLDLAIQVMLDSFLASNKISVTKLLRRKFRKYMSYYRDNEELLHHLIKTIAQEHYKFELYNNTNLRRAQLDDGEFDETSSTRTVEFDADEFETRAKEFNIHDVSYFYNSRVFKHYGYRLNERRDSRDRVVKTIVKEL